MADLNNAQSEQDSRYSSIKNDRDLQTALASENHDKYQKEVLAHAQSVNQLQDLKNEVRGYINESQNAVQEKETAVSKLKASENSWNQQKEIILKESEELNKRYNELVNQNNVLHKHLENVNAQAAKITEKEASSTNNVNIEQGKEVNDESDLQSVISYLRNEREYVDLQLSLVKQENVRYKTQLEHVNKSLDETRSILNEERQKLSNGDLSAVQHAELITKIEQLNTYRESNTTLRSESTRNRNKVLELEKKLQEFEGSLQPLQDQVRNLQAELEVSKKNVEHWKEDSERWQARNQAILGKYERIDPVELQKAKDEANNYSTELSEAKKVIESNDVNVSDIMSIVLDYFYNLINYF